MDNFESWKDLLNPEFYIQLGGFWLILFIIFAETGLFIGFFLPGDTLLFVAGIYSRELISATFGTFGSDLLDTTVLALFVAAAAIIGNQVGYWFGTKTGNALYQREDTFYFKKKNLNKAHDFFESNGAFAVIGARFLPIIRTFVPIIAGIVKMDRRKFFIDNVIGGLAWSFSMIFAGHYLDSFFRSRWGIELKDHLELIILIIVLVTTFPVIIKFFFSKNKKQK